MLEKFTIKAPFSRHGHLRELATLMRYILRHITAQYWGMVAMPNLSIAVTTWQQAEKYIADIVSVLKEQSLGEFKIIMTAYLTDNTDPNNIREGFERGVWQAVKLYPFGATTNSDQGVTKLEKIFPVLAMMEKIGMPLLVHPETDISRHKIGFLDRERVFVEESLVKIHAAFPQLNVSVEHITTIEAAQFVEDCPDNVVGTVTPQHLLYDYNALFHNGVPPYKPGFYAENMCLPILKYPEDVAYIRNAIMRGSKKEKFGAGDDDAAHDQTLKHDHCSRCGVFNGTHSVEFYAMAFDEENMLSTAEGILVFENFMSVNNLEIYGLKPSPKLIELRREETLVPELVEGNIRPFKAGQTIPFKMYQLTV